MLLVKSVSVQVEHAKNQIAQHRAHVVQSRICNGSRVSSIAACGGSSLRYHACLRQRLGQMDKQLSLLSAGD